MPPFGVSGAAVSGTTSRLRGLSLKNLSSTTAWLARPLRASVIAALAAGARDVGRMEEEEEEEEEEKEEDASALHAWLAAGAEEQRLENAEATARSSEVLAPRTPADSIAIDLLVTREWKTFNGVEEKKNQSVLADEVTLLRVASTQGCVKLLTFPTPLHGPWNTQGRKGFLCAIGVNRSSSACV
jgi:hypothetical protein